ncbi:hypothetical protein ScalyP_jg650, partial [Parmales sp. scaly parma]
MGVVRGCNGLLETGGALVSWAQKKAMNDREFWVKFRASE